MSSSEDIIATHPLPLMNALWNAHHRVAKLLIQSGAQLNLQDVFGTGGMDGIKLFTVSV